jgi:hypothetical protein
MVAQFQRTLRDGREYEKYFDVRQLQRTDRVVKNGNTFVTVDLMAQLARTYQSDTAGVAKVLRGKSLEATCRNIWEFAYRHFQYTEDKDGVEQLRRPLRAWADRRAGIDCDCFSILCSTILLNLGIAHKLRKTKYNGGTEYQHIYVVVPKPSGGHFTIDPVTDAFDKEVPFSAKFDKTMTPVQVLNGPAMPIQVLNGMANTTDSKSLVPVGKYRKFGFGAEFMGLEGEAEQVRQQTLATVRTVSLQGLAAVATSDVVPTADQVAEIARLTGQTADEAAADYVAVAHASASFVERLRQSLTNTGDQIDRLPAEHRGPELVRLRARINLLLASWTNEPERTRLFAVLGAQEDAELRAAGLSGLGLGSFFSAIGDAIGSAVSSVGNAVSSAAGGVAQAANWTYGHVLTPIGQAIAQAASWVANTVLSAAKAAAQGIKNAVKWVAKEALALAKLAMKYNPLAVLIRFGLRISFRVNLFYMSGRLGNGYFSEAQAQAFGMNLDEWRKCKDQLGKVIAMWEGLQGDTDVLQESILIGYQSGNQPKIAAQPLQGLPVGLAGGLGDGGVVSGPSAVAASGFIATIMSWLRSVDWDKLLKGVKAAEGVVSSVLAKFKSVPAVTENTLLPSSEQAYQANRTLYDTQPTTSTSMVVPLAIGASALVGLLLFTKKPS